jgi:hypothetical protein
MEGVPLNKIPGWLAAVSAAVCIFFIGIRFGWFGPHLTPQALGMKLDKWQIGPLRVINLAAFMVCAYWSRKYVLKLIHREPFITLGMASLRVFCAHIVFVFAGLTMLYGDFNSDGLDQLHGVPAVALLACTLASLIWLASREVRNKRRQKLQKTAEIMSISEPQHKPDLAKTGT